MENTEYFYIATLQLYVTTSCTCRTESTGSLALLKRLCDQDLDCTEKSPGIVLKCYCAFTGLPFSTHNIAVGDAFDNTCLQHFDNMTHVSTKNLFCVLTNLADVYAHKMYLQHRPTRQNYIPLGLNRVVSCMMHVM